MSSEKFMVRCSLCTMAFCVVEKGPTCKCKLCEAEQEGSPYKYTIERCSRCKGRSSSCFQNLPHLCTAMCRLPCKYLKAAK